METRYARAQWAPSPNHTIGRDGYLAVVLHIAQGSYAGSLGWLRNPASKASSHFLVGEDGRVAQLVDLANTAWTNGLSQRGGQWRNARGKIVAPTWSLLTSGMDPNRNTITIEHAGFTNQPRPRAQVEAVTALLVWIGQHTGLRYRVGETLIGHSHLDNVDRALCPGPLVDLGAYAAAANARLVISRPYRTRIFTPVLESPGVSPLQVAWNGGCIIPPGQVIDLEPTAWQGWLHWRNDGFVEAAAVEPLAPATPSGTPLRLPTLPYTADSPVLGSPVVDEPALAEAFYARCRRAGSPYAFEGDNPITTVIVPGYLATCQRGGVDVYVALAQCAEETGSLTSALSQREDKDGNVLRNPAGVGVNGDVSPGPAEGFVWDSDRRQYRRCVGFATWEAAIVAQVGRLIAYATTPEQRTLAQQELVAIAMEARALPDPCHGSAPTLRELGSGPNPVPGCGWAGNGDGGGLTYGADIAAIAEALRKAATR